VGLRHFDLADDEAFVYGDLSGSVFYTHAGFRVKL